MCPVLYHEYRSVWRARRGAPSCFFHEYDLLYHHGSFLFWHSLPCFWQALPCKLTSHMHTVRCHSVLPWKYHAPTRPGLIQTGASGTWCLQVPPARSFFSSADQPMKQCLAHRRLHRTSKVLAILLGFWKLRNFLRPISASMKEAKAKRHLPFWIALRLVLCLAQLISDLVPLRSAACVDWPWKVPQLPEAY